MKNILENVNLDSVNYGVTTNSQYNSNALQLSRERIMSLAPNTDPVNPDNSAACLFQSRAFCGSYARNCSNHSCGGNILCVNVGNVHPVRVEIGGWTFAKDSQGC